MKGPLSTVDVIVEYEAGLVLIRRKYPPYKGRYAVPGGFVESGETLEEAAVREILEETNLDIEIMNPGRPRTYSAPGRDPRGPVISHLYFARGHGDLHAGDDAAYAERVRIDDIESMLGRGLFAFDHEEMIRDYLTWRKQCVLES